MIEKLNLVCMKLISAGKQLMACVSDFGRQMAVMEGLGEGRREGERERMWMGDD